MSYGAMSERYCIEISCVVFDIVTRVFNGRDYPVGFWYRMYGTMFSNLIIF